MTVKRLAIRIAVGVVSVALAGMLLAFGYYKYQRARVARAIAIDTATGIDSLEAPIINGVPQWVQIRGHDRNNPVLLFITSGIGMPMMPMAHLFQPAWERDFTVVQWDPRLTGKTSSIEAAAQSIPEGRITETLVQDALEVSRYAAQRTGQRKIGIVAHSFGSVVGLDLVARHPELFYAYVGVGQILDAREQERAAYRFSLDRARRASRQDAIDELEAMRSYPDDAIAAADRNEKRRLFLTNMKWLMSFHGDFVGGQPHERHRRAIYLSPAYDLGDIRALFKPRQSPLLFGSYLQERLTARFDDEDLILRVPVLLFEGRHDQEASSAFIEARYARIQAPHKRLLWLERSAHFPMLEEPDRFQELLRQELLPLAAANSAR